MKILKKLNLVEIIVILCIVVATLSLGYNFLIKNENKYTFDGTEMYKCAWVANNILNKGFPLKAYIEGHFRGGKPFNGTVEIVKAHGGTLHAIYNNSIITIGGELAYKEDIAAKKIKLIPIGKAIIIEKVKPIEANNFKDIYIKILNISNKYKKYNIRTIYLIGSFGVDSKTYTPSERQQINNKLYVDINRGLNIFYVENGTILSNKLYLGTMEKLDSILKPKKIVTSELKVYIVVDKIPKHLDNEVITL
ncbi:hypothetical protein ACPB8Q_01930 [Methanocaldococcus indicus]|uniref:TrmB family transcriptional regulator sugar-binding domain-containing protein n=1 Tax=Methanocaldococcus indicus TaxID=213231 RepID=UPI003C6CD787